MVLQLLMRVRSVGAWAHWILSSSARWMSCAPGMLVFHAFIPSGKAEAPSIKCGVKYDGTPTQGSVQSAVLGRLHLPRCLSAIAEAYWL